MLKTKIDELRRLTGDNSWYDHFEYLQESMREYSKKKNAHYSWEKTEDEIQQFISGELETFNDISNSGLHENVQYVDINSAAA